MKSRDYENKVLWKTKGQERVVDKGLRDKRDDIKLRVEVRLISSLGEIGMK